MSATLALPHVDRLPSPEHREVLSQWETPAALATRIIDWIGTTLDDATRRGYSLHILEPSAGSGALLRPLIARCPGAVIDAVDVDPGRAAQLAMLPVRVEICDYLQRPAPHRRYDLTITNPPFTGGVEAAHLAKMLDESERVIALLPARALHGAARYESVWSRFDGIDANWGLRRLALLVGRPRFVGGGGQDEIVIVDLHRRPGSTEVEWW